MTPANAITYCRLCEAGCGVEVELDAAGAPVSVKPDRAHVVSRGFLCTKAAALAELVRDPRRLLEPKLRPAGSPAGTLTGVSWDTATSFVADTLTRIAREHGPNAIAFYQGNPTAFSWEAAVSTAALARILGTSRFYTASSIDCAERFVVADLCFGHPLLVTIPDLRNAHHAMLLGGNPAVSTWAQLTSIPRWIEDVARLRRRGGRFVVVDPRRTETAVFADEHVAVKPGSDADLLLAFVHVILREGLEDKDFLRTHAIGLDEARAAIAEYTPERAALRTGLDVARIERLAREFAAAPAGFAVGHSGLTMNARGSIAEWAIILLNAVCGRFDRRGGLLLNPGILDLTRLGDWLFDRQAPLPPEVRPPARRILDDLPCVILTEAIERGSVKALVVIAGNPAVTFPNASRFRRALDTLDLLVGIDPYVNETHRRAHVVLPPPSMLERDDCVLLNSGFLAEPYGQVTRAVCAPPPQVRGEWWMSREIARKLGPFSNREPGATWGRRLRVAARRRMSSALLRLEPKTALRWMLRVFSKTSLTDLERHPHGLRLGELRPGDLFARVKTAGRKMRLAPPEILDLLRRESASAPEGPSPTVDSQGKPPDLPFTLLSRRRRGAMNSWLDRLPSAQRVDPRPAIEIAPSDAETLDIREGDAIALVNTRGRYEGIARISPRCAAGIVTAPHGTRDLGTLDLQANFNDLVSDEDVDPLTGMPQFNNTRVRVAKMARQ